MIPPIQAMWQEFEQESIATRRHLERVPEGKLDWRPHEKSMSLGQLAVEISRVAAVIGKFLQTESVDLDQVDFTPPTARTRKEVLNLFEGSLGETKAVLESLTEATLAETWSARKDGKVVMTLPKSAMVRMMMFNHIYHHRGQMSVYLRLLDVPVPATYGRSADESSF